jgi:hypothetical protein
MNDINWFTWIFDSYKDIFGFANKIYDFLFYEFSILGIGDISLWLVVTGVGLTAILVAGIAKAVTPLI